MESQSPSPISGPKAPAVLTNPVSFPGLPPGVPPLIGPAPGAPREGERPPIRRAAGPRAAEAAPAPRRGLLDGVSPDATLVRKIVGEIRPVLIEVATAIDTAREKLPALFEILSPHAERASLGENFDLTEAEHFLTSVTKALDALND